MKRDLFPYEKELLIKYDRYLKKVKKFFPLNSKDKLYVIRTNEIIEFIDYEDEYKLDNYSERHFVLQLIYGNNVGLAKKKCPKNYTIKKELGICIKKEIVYDIPTKKDKEKNFRKFMKIIEKYDFHRRKDLETQGRFIFFDEENNIYYDVLKGGRGVYVEIPMFPDPWYDDNSEDIIVLFFRDTLPIDKITDIVMYYRETNKFMRGARQFLKKYYVEPIKKFTEETTIDLQEKEGKDTFIRKFLNIFEW